MAFDENYKELIIKNDITLYYYNVSNKSINKNNNLLQNVSLFTDKKVIVINDNINIEASLPSYKILPIDLLFPSIG